MPNPDGPDDEVIDTEAAPIPDGFCRFGFRPEVIWKMKRRYSRASCR